MARCSKARGVGHRTAGRGSCRVGAVSDTLGTRFAEPGSVRCRPYRRSPCGVRNLAARTVLVRRGPRPRRGAFARRDHRVGARPARLRLPRRGARLPRGRAARPRPVRARRHARRRSRRSPPPSRRAPGSASTATTTPTASARPRWPSCSCASSAVRDEAAQKSLAPAVAVRGGIRPQRGHADAARRGGLRARADRRLRDHRRRRGRARARARARGRRHRPPPPGGRVPGVPGRRAAARAATRSRGSAAPASSGSSRRRCSARRTRSSTATSTSSRSRRSPTSCRSSTRTARSRCSACAGSRRRRSRACAR